MNGGASTCQGISCNSKLAWTVSPFVFGQGDLPNSGDLDLSGDSLKRCVSLDGGGKMEERECGNPSTEYRSACQCDEAPTTGESVEEYSFFKKN